jgi:hypothetical protein
MPVESATYINQLDDTLPTGANPKSEGDNHIRLVKDVLKNTLPNLAGAVSASDVELSHVSGVTAPIQTQINAKAPTASPTLTGTPAAPTAAIGTNTTQLATTEFVERAVASASVASYTYTTSAVSKQLVNLEHCVLTATGQTVTLPAYGVGRTVKVTTRLNVACTIARNADATPILGLAEDLSQPFLNGPLTLTFVCVNATDGWVFE